ncbi:MAG: hypothetical protein AAGU76_11300 [Sedimentibacter sp.]|uniref:hypothetical protein n=1 Tax=Sedimentibacter sp. TaxID=1960295 RepID=UPI003158243E
MSEENIKKFNFKEPHPIKLLKNKSYPTYQLYATVLNKTDPEKAIVICVLETMSWLRKRFRELEMPQEIMFPEPDDFEGVTLNDFKSFRINEGYVVDVVFVKEKGIWAFHLIEPDLGPDPGNENQRRQPVPGRVFETNIAFRIFNGKVECGFKTVCSEPESTREVCEVFRLAVVKSIVKNKNLGLEQVLPITRDAQTISSNEGVDNVIGYITSKERQIPYVLIAEYKKELDISKLKIEKPEFDVHSLIYRSIDELMGITSDDATDGYTLFLEKLNKTINHRMGYAQFAFLPNKYLEYFNENCARCKASNGSIIVFYPEKFKSACKKYDCSYIMLNEDKFLKNLEDELQEYSKYKIYDFGHVKFINEARIEELQRVIDISNSKEEIIAAYEDKIRSIASEKNNDLNMLKSAIIEKDDKIERLKEIIDKLDAKDDVWIAEIEKINHSYDERIDKLKQELKRKDILLGRPKKTEEVPDWVEKYFSGRLIFHDRAKSLISKTPTTEVDMNLLCDAIEYLAHEYRAFLTGEITKEECAKACSETYNRNFNVSPSGDMSIQAYSFEYKVKYGVGFTGKPKEVALNQHLKVGNENKNLLRIYFFYDNDKKLIVVGSLPKHLKTITEK